MKSYRNAFAVSPGIHKKASAMTNAEGFLGIIILLDITFFLAGICLLTGMYLVLARISCRPAQIALPFIVMTGGYLAFMNADAPMLLATTLAAGIPAAVMLMAMFVYQKRQGLPSYKHILISNTLVSLAGAFLPFLLVWSGLSMKPAIFWHTPFTNGILYGFAMALFLVVAGLVICIMSRSDKASKTVDEGK
jgi:hypothetical protein